MIGRFKPYYHDVVGETGFPQRDPFGRAAKALLSQLKNHLIENKSN